MEIISHLPPKVGNCPGSSILGAATLLAEQPPPNPLEPRPRPRPRPLGLQNLSPSAGFRNSLMLRDYHHHQVKMRISTCHKNIIQALQRIEKKNTNKEKGAHLQAFQQTHEIEDCNHTASIKDYVQNFKQMMFYNIIK